MPNPGDEARRKLIERERASQLRVIAEFKKIQNRISAELFELMKRIDTIRRTEGNAPVGLMIEQARMRALFDQVTDEIADASRRLGIVAENSQRRAIEIARTQAGEYAELAAQLNQFDAAATRNLIGLAGDGGRLDRYFAAIGKPVREQMFEALFYGLATGQPNQTIAREVNQAIGFGAARAMTIVRTETNRAYRESSRQFYADAPGVIGWRWVAALDLRTCILCWSQHGKIFKTRTKFATHPNCRCTLVPVFGDEPDQKEQTGPAQFARLTIEQQRTIAGPRRLDLYNQGANLADFVEVYRSPFGPGRRIKPIDRITFRSSPRSPAASASARRNLKPAGKPESALQAFKAIKDGEPLPTFKTTAEATAYMESRFPTIRFDFEGIDVDGGLLQAQAEQFTRLAEQYPDVADRIEYIGAYKDRDKWKGLATDGKFGPRDNAHALLNGTLIAFNPKKFGDAAEYTKRKKHAFAVGWSVTDDIAGTLTHEFGHLLDGLLHRLGRHSLTEFVDPAGKSDIATLAAAIRKKHKPKAAAELSEYGLTNKYELFAEAFAAYHHRPASEHSVYVRMISKLIEFVMQKRFDPANKKRLGSLIDDPAAYAAAKKEIQDLYREFELPVPRIR